MSSALLASSAKMPFVPGRRDRALEGDFVKDQLDQVAAEQAEASDESPANPEPDKSGFVANQRDFGGDNVIPLSFKAAKFGRKSVHTLTRWNGYVDHIDLTHFTAIVYDATRGGKDREEAKIPLRLLDKSEREHLKLGAQLQLIVGLSNAAAGNRVKETIVYFRRYVESQPSIADDLIPLLARLRDEAE